MAHSLAVRVLQKGAEGVEVVLVRHLEDGASLVAMRAPRERLLIVDALRVRGHVIHRRQGGHGGSRQEQREARKRAGIAKPGAEASRPPPNVGRLAAPNPNDPLSRIPKAGQELLERFFGGGALVFGSAFILSGLAVAVEAIAKVLGNPLPTPIDEALVQYVEPALTPSILILFGFSISLGLLKQLQLGSESTGVLYREEDE